MNFCVVTLTNLMLCESFDFSIDSLLKIDLTVNFQVPYSNTIRL